MIVSHIKQNYKYLRDLIINQDYFCNLIVFMLLKIDECVLV